MEDFRRGQCYNRLSFRSYCAQASKLAFTIEHFLAATGKLCSPLGAYRYRDLKKVQVGSSLLVGPWPMFISKHLSICVFFGPKVLFFNFNMKRLYILSLMLGD
jgi:hypothetical protein